MNIYINKLKFYKMFYVVKDNLYFLKILLIGLFFMLKYILLLIVYKVYGCILVFLIVFLVFL